MCCQGLRNVPRRMRPRSGGLSACGRLAFLIAVEQNKCINFLCTVGSDILEDFNRTINNVHNHEIVSIINPRRPHKLVFIDRNRGQKLV